MLDGKKKQTKIQKALSCTLELCATANIFSVDHVLRSVLRLINLVYSYGYLYRCT